MNTVLYLDDSNCALRLLERILKGHANTICCPTPAEAEQAMAANSIDCLVCDHMLGDSDGITFARKVRASRKYSQIPIILVSAGITPTLAHKAMKYGINQCVPKPFSPAVIREVIDRQIECPTIHKVDRTHITPSCILWESGGSHHQYSPDLEVKVSAPTKEQAHERMRQALKEWIAEHGSKSDTILELNLVQHIFEL